ncbi:MAG: hypothetical protein HFI93_01170 [Lachnospiraceae bacterium]|nr:hypothetical protein [Lachnospiraceae bacterium]
MFAKGDYIIYGNSGVCRVDEIGTPAGVASADEGRIYYTLTPVYGTGTIYIPVDGKVFMRPVISRDEAERLIDRIPEIREDTCEHRDQKLLANHYKSFIQSHECEDLVQLIKSIYARNQYMIRNGKKAGTTDRQYMKKAEELLHGELSVVLELSLEEVPAYIARRLEENGRMG